MGIVTVILGCAFILLSGCMENHREAKAPVSSASAQDYCQQRQAPCPNVYSPSWHNVFN